MNRHDELAALIPFYASGALDEPARRAVETHLLTCEECRADLALWRETRSVVKALDDRLPMPPPLALANVMNRVSKKRPSTWSWAWQLVRAQIPLVRREIWLTSAAVMALGYFVASASQNAGTAGSIVDALAPLLAAACVALIYGPENDPALELAAATPTSPWQVLLARLVLILAYNLVLALAATLGLVGLIPMHALTGIILNWLAPMLFLSSLALVASLVLGTSNAITAAFGLWIARLYARTLLSAASPGLSASVLNLAGAYDRTWSNTTALFVLAALLLALGLWLANRGPARLPSNAT